MREELRARFSEAVTLKEQGELGPARKILLELTEMDSKSPAIFAVLGDVCWDMKDHEAAVIFFKHATELSPTLEAVSLGLFHCLWKLDRRNEATEEVMRFQSVSDSKDYGEIVREINQRID